MTNKTFNETYIFSQANAVVRSNLDPLGDGSNMSQPSAIERVYIELTPIAAMERRQRLSMHGHRVSVRRRDISVRLKDPALSIQLQVWLVFGHGSKRP
tara:strand:+ start:633 stop:926 length:294 start_codon:yes stop_codon:yes gene_type:complete